MILVGAWEDCQDVAKTPFVPTYGAGSAPTTLTMRFSQGVEGVGGEDGDLFVGHTQICLADRVAKGE